MSYPPAYPSGYPSGHAAGYGATSVADPTAVIGKRILAFVLDGLFVFLIWLAALVSLGTHRTDVPSSFCDGRELGTHLCLQGGGDAFLASGGKAFAIYALPIGAWLVNAVVIEALTGGSVGKLVVGLRVVQADGRPAGFGRVLVRAALMVVAFFVSFIFLAGFIAELIVACVTKPHRRVGDMAAGTYVVGRHDVGRPVRPAAAWGAASPWGPAPQPQWGGHPGWGPPAGPTPYPGTPGTYGSGPAPHPGAAPAPAPTGAQPWPGAQPAPQPWPGAPPAPAPGTGGGPASAPSSPPTEDQPGWASPTPASPGGWGPVAGDPSPWGPAPAPTSQPAPQPAAQHAPWTPAPAPQPTPAASPTASSTHAPPKWDDQLQAWTIWDPPRRQWMQWDDARQEWRPMTRPMTPGPGDRS